MIICDPGPLVALLNGDDKYHQACTDLLEREHGPIVVPAPVLTEVCYLTESRMGPATEAAFLDAVASGEFQLEATQSSGLSRMADLVRTYADFPLGAC